MSNLQAWRCEHQTEHGYNRWLTEDAVDAESARIAGCRVTPLVVAPPEGAPTYAELVQGLRDARTLIGAARPDGWDNDLVENGVNEGDWQAGRMRDVLDALLFRIPKDAVDTEDRK